MALELPCQHPGAAPLLTHACGLQVTEGVKQLAEIIASFEAAFDGVEGSTGEEEFAAVLAAVADPLLTACERSAEALSPDAPTR